MRNKHWKNTIRMFGTVQIKSINDFYVRESGDAGLLNSNQL